MDQIENSTSTMKQKPKTQIFRFVEEIKFLQNSLEIKDIEEIRFVFFNQESFRLFLKQCKHLKKVSINFNVLEKDFYLINQLESLESLQVSEMRDINTWRKIKDTQIQSKRKSKVKKLELRGYLDDILQIVAEVYPELQSLGVLLYFCQENVDSLKKLKHLKQLKFYNSIRIDLSQLRLLTLNFPYLTSICMNLCNITDEQLEVIVQLQNLATLEVSYHKISPKGIKYLNVLSKTLKKLYIHTSSYLIKPPDIKYILQNFLKLKEFEISASHLSLEIFQMDQSKFERLQSLIIHSYIGLPLNQVNKFFEKLVNLREIYIYYSFDNKTAQTIGTSMKSMERLTLFCSNHQYLENTLLLNDSGYFYISKLKGLKFFQANNSKRGDIGVLKLIRNVKKASLLLETNFVGFKVQQKTKRNALMLEFYKHDIVKI